MKLLKIYLYFSLFILIFISCYEPYYPDDLGAGEKVLVVQGILNNEPGPYMIQLTWATTFEEYKIDPVPGAHIVLSDDKGNSEIYQELNSGFYFTGSDGILGTPGNSYTLRITLPDGSIYESVPAIMPPVPSWDTLYAEIGEKRTVSKDPDGELIYNDYEGLYTYIDLKLSPDEQRFYRFGSSHYIQYMYTVGSGAYARNFYCFGYRTSQEFPNVKSTVLSNREEIIKKHELGFLTYLYDPSTATGTRTADRPEGWILCSTVYSIDEYAYKYYKGYLDQLNEEERIFDPVPSQILGNIRCVSDNKKPATGLFEVASIRNYYTAFRWQSGMSIYLRKDIPEGLWKEDDACYDSDKTNFWVNFY